MGMNGSMKLKRTAILTLLCLLLQQAGAVLAAVSPGFPMADFPQPITLQGDETTHAHVMEHGAASTTRQHHGTEATLSSPQSHEEMDHGEHCDDCQCCGVLGCYVAVHGSAMPVVASVLNTCIQDYLTLYSGNVPPRLDRPPSLL